MQPPQYPGPYAGPPFPGPGGPPGPPPPGYGRPGPYPPVPGGPPHRARRAPLIIVGLVAFLLVAGIGGFLYLHGSQPEGRFRTRPSACWLVTQTQVDAYLPGAVSDGGEDGFYCSWGKPVGARDQTGRLTVAVEALGDNSSIKDAHQQYDIRRRQADEPGTKITSLSIGDEAFMACGAPTRGGGRSCEIDTRVSNVVFNVEFESFPVPGAREPSTSVQALAAAAVQHLRQSS